MSPTVNLPGVDRESLTRVNVSEQSNSGPFFLQSGYDAANNSPSRGYVYWPGTDTKRELSSFSDAEIRRRVHWLYANFGFARRMVNGMAKLIGVLTPQPNTGDDDWDELAFEAFMQSAGSAEIFDAAGKFDFFTAQPQWNRSRFKDGRSLGVFTDSPTGRNRMAFYEAHQITNPTSTKPDPRLEQGVYLNRMGKHIGYSLRDGEDLDKYSTIDAKDCIYFGRHETHGAVHGISILAHCVTNMIDVVETRGFWKKKIKDASRTGIVRERELPTAVVGSGGMGGAVIKQMVKMPDGTSQEINWETVMAGGQVPTLEPGESLRVISDQNPSEQNQAFEKALFDDCIFGSDLPPAALAYVTGITGPGIRYTMEDIERWITMEHLWQARKAHRIYTRDTAMSIKSGRLPDPKIPWWRFSKVAWIGMPSMTIDKGREGNLSIIQLQSGTTTWAKEWGKEGVFWKKGIRQRIKEVAYAKAECAAADLDYSEVFPNIVSTVAVGFPPDKEDDKAA